MSNFPMTGIVQGRALVSVDPLVLATIEVPCPIPDCGSIVYAPNDDNMRIDCLDCGAALLTRLGIDGAVTLEVTDDPVVTVDPKEPPPPRAVGRHVAVFNSSEPSDDPLPLGGWQRTDSKEETHG